RTLKITFPISDDQVDVLLSSGWHWTAYRDPTQADVDVGYMQATVSKSDYQSVIGKVAETTGDKSGEPVEEKLGQQTLYLLKTGKLYELNKKISALESLIQSEMISGIPEMGGLDIDWESIKKHEAELDALKKERQEELHRLGLTLDAYE